ncbi:hypothetical protein [Rhodobacter capsulatus]|uniref:hypothetical protein n=1 Tax=Rhodobacter capsulatus TaxID=1061 RepID=UPI0011BD01AF|nr:hypothetical protein [Rhodobacter capsulatus]
MQQTVVNPLPRRPLGAKPLFLCLQEGRVVESRIRFSVADLERQRPEESRPKLRNLDIIKRGDAARIKVGSLFPSGDVF